MTTENNNYRVRHKSVTPLYPTNGLLAAFKMAAVAPMSRISYSFTPNHYILRARCLRHAVRGMKGC